MSDLKSKIEELEQKRNLINREIEVLEAEMDSANGAEILKALVNDCRLSLRMGYNNFLVVPENDNLSNAIDKYQLAHGAAYYHCSIPIDKNYNIRVDDDRIQLVNSYLDPKTCEENSGFTHTIEFLKSIGFPKDKVDYSEYEKAIQEKKNRILSDEDLLGGIRFTFKHLYK